MYHTINLIDCNLVGNWNCNVNYSKDWFQSRWTGVILGLPCYFLLNPIFIHTVGAG